jgi:hypothetical protein
MLTIWGSFVVHLTQVELITHFAHTCSAAYAHHERATATKRFSSHRRQVHIPGYCFHRFVDHEDHGNNIANP